MPCAAVIVGQCAPLHMLEWSFFFFSKKLSEDLVFQFFLKKSFDYDMFLLYIVVTINSGNRTLCYPIQSLIIWSSSVIYCCYMITD